MKLNKRDIKRLADLARLNLSDAEYDSLPDELSDILNYVQQLDQVDTKGLKPTLQVNYLNNVFRPDQIKDYGYKPLDLLKNIPKTQDNQIRSARMID